MILYLDASALIKRYVVESGSDEVKAAVAQAASVGTVILSRAEVSAALAKAVRMNALTKDDAESSLTVFRSQWPDLVRIRTTETLVARADSLAWSHNLRGNDSIQLAAADFWQDAMAKPVTFATFDKGLWQAANQLGLAPFPADLLPFLAKSTGGRALGADANLSPVT